MDQNQELELARVRAREILSDNNSFKSMPLEDQRRMYNEVVLEELTKIRQNSGLALDLANNNQRRVPGRASDFIDDSRHAKGFEEGVDAFEELVDSVDFPKFVGDLLKAVFDANISVMKAQTDDYMRLMKMATTDLAKFIKEVSDEDAKTYAAQNNPGYNIVVEEDENGGEKIALTQPNGERVDEEKEKALMADAKIKMAQEHRTALREMILMGITRLVVDKGEIEAEVNFEFKGNRNVEKKDKAINQKDKLNQFGGGYSGGFLGSIFGGPGGSARNTSKETQLSVSSTKSNAEDELKAKLRGFVNIKFKTDYFKLDNFAQMYGPPSQEERQAAAATPAIGAGTPNR